MQYEINNQGKCTVFQINEERFDAKLAPQFRKEAEELLSQIGDHLILDLGSVKFMDSSGLGAIMGVYKLCRGKTVSVVHLQKPVEDLLKLTRMNRLIPNYSTLEDAMLTSA
ncbi:anti-sigma factor antagonist [Aliivibrio fischeri]|uniref:STAS domain-containing protein n=1 Tax=Aliivibrio fischeri TaxID=668 RepID=UPI0007C5122B|nr:STAS domain-containing protein [Aliivibrio fischeri]MUK38713.1 anti-sigma factor antagonist [Aliivibrio fischeri]MUK92738.1 anti-sigma factor antagonist [Aliivibrio fischeri]MUL01715.1 anti-sigma factor antagonist [Aliivibrio fischeri]MUL04845.1 anti-sigma factor antagonist [Aliivibrio fischeri]